MGKLAIIGATGRAGGRLLDQHPDDELESLAAGRSALPALHEQAGDR